ncbi:hypothetical protein ACH4PU_30940 [Streptomyces sp. NPDC021100]|uniref:hypothetical protein n=1 Tax=Streptomyces sp. NPDC021100 TaxID=3365114 RepID=UPI0037AAEBC2
MTTAFSVYVEFDRPGADPDTCTRLLDALEQHAPDAAVGPAENRNLSVRLFVDAGSVAHAFTLGLDAVQRAAVSCGISPDTVTAATVITEDEFDRREAQSEVPELAGLAEAADIIGVSGNGLGRLLAELEPHVVQVLKTGPLFLASGLEEVRARHALSPAQQSLLDALNAVALGAAPPTALARQAAEAVTDVRPDGRLRVRQGTTSRTSTLLSALADRALVELHQDVGDSGDVLVTVTARGRRHATAPADDTQATGAAQP